MPAVIQGTAGDPGGSSGQLLTLRRNDGSISTCILVGEVSLS